MESVVFYRAHLPGRRTDGAKFRGGRTNSIAINPERFPTYMINLILINTRG